MTTLLDIANRGLQAMGTRTNMSLTEFNNQSSNEAIQTQLVIYNLRDEILRMAPWNSATNTNNLQFITSTPGTPENVSNATIIWQKGQPTPPWGYEYQYPGDCLRPLWIIPSIQTGFAGGVPITTAVTGGVTNFWTGPPAKFKVGIDQFFAVSAATVAAGGTGYAVGDFIYLAPGYYSPSNLPTASPPIGCPAILQVATLGAGNSVATVSVVNTFSQAEPENTEPVSGSYFLPQANPIAQGTTSGSGSGATFNCTFTAQMDQRVIYTNQEFATLCYIKQVTDPNVMDPNLIQAWVAGLAGRLAYQLTGDKALANMKIAEANAYIAEARKNDGNEGLTVNDVTPDWIRARGVNYVDWAYSPNQDFDWGAYLAFY